MRPLRGGSDEEGGVLLSQQAAAGAEALDLMGEIAAGVQVGERRVGGTGGSRGVCGKDGWGREGEYFENPEGSGIDLDMSPSKFPYPLSD